MSKTGKDTNGSIFDDFTQVTWAKYQKMLDAHERAAWLEGYKAAKLEIIKSKVMEKGE